MSFVAPSTVVFVIVDVFRLFRNHTVMVAIMCFTPSTVLTTAEFYCYNDDTLVHSRTNVVSIDIPALACNDSTTTMSPSVHVCAL